MARPTGVGPRTWELTARRNALERRLVRPTRPLLGNGPRMTGGWLAQRPGQGALQLGGFLPIQMGSLWAGAWWSSRRLSIAASEGDKGPPAGAGLGEGLHPGDRAHTGWGLGPRAEVLAPGQTSPWATKLEETIGD